MNKCKGFTLVELMVVLAVIALLLSVVVPDYMGKMRRAEEVGLGGSPETAREEEGLLPDDDAETFDNEDDDQEER